MVHSSDVEFIWRYHAMLLYLPHPLSSLLHDVPADKFNNTAPFPFTDAGEIKN
jgi:hypothetical protein